MNIYIKILAIITMVAIFYEGFVIPLGNSRFQFCYVIFMLLLFITYLLGRGHKIINTIKFLYKKTPFKYLAFFVIWLYIDALILVLMGKAKILIFYYITFKLLLTSFLCYGISTFFIPRYISLKKSIQILIIIFIFINITALIGYIGEIYNISILKFFLNTFSNLKEVAQGITEMTDSISGSARLRGIFAEHGGFGKYILLFSPIVYKICLSKYKIFENVLFNKLIKIIIIPLSLFCVILTKSPMMLVFIFGFIFCYFFKHLLFYIKKFFIPLLISVLIIFLIFSTIDLDLQLQSTYLYRIVNTVTSINSFERFVIVEPSLASRIVSYVNSFNLFLKNPLLGFGYDNARFYMLNMFITSPLPLTGENMLSIKNAIENNVGIGFNRSLLSELLLETGLIGTFLYYLFLWKQMQYIDRIKPYFFGIERKFLEGLKITIIIVIALSFYLYNFATSYLYFFYGFICSYITQYYINKRNGRYK